MVMRFLQTPGAGPAQVEDDHGIQVLTASLWDSVVRIADGRTADRQDEVILRRATEALRGQMDMLRFVSTQSATGPIRAVQGTDTLIDLIWTASDQLGIETFSSASSSGIDSLVYSLDAVANGDQAAAKSLDPLLERVAVLAEQADRD